MDLLGHGELQKEQQVARSISSLSADEMIEGVSETRASTVQDLFRLAERIWAESGTERPAFAWGGSCAPIPNDFAPCARRSLPRSGRPRSFAAARRRSGRTEPPPSKLSVMCNDPAEMQDGDRLPCR